VIQQSEFSRILLFDSFQSVCIVMSVQTAVMGYLFIYSPDLSLLAIEFWKRSG